MDQEKNQDHWVKTGTVQYLLNVCDKISRKIPAVVVKDAKHPAFLQTIFMYDFDHVAFLEVKKCGLLGHMIVQSPYILHLLKRNQQHGRLRSTSIQRRRNMKTQQSPMILDSCLRKTGGGGESNDYGDVIVWEKLRFQNVFCPNWDKAAISIFPAVKWNEPKFFLSDSMSALIGQYDPFSAFFTWNVIFSSEKEISYSI